MEALHKIVLDNFLLLFAIGLLWNVVGIGFMLWKRKKRGLVFPKPSDAEVVFAERFASGSSNKSWITRFGGASNCLTVIVTNTHVAITTFFPFTALAGFYDLEHLIPVSDITDIEPKGKVTEIEFKVGDRINRKLSLRLTDTTGFMRALERQTKGRQVAGDQLPARPEPQAS